jgi:hypothetical protein
LASDVDVNRSRDASRACQAIAGAAVAPHLGGGYGMDLASLLDTIIITALYVFAILAAFYLVTNLNLEHISQVSNPAIRFLLFLAFVPLIYSPLGAVWSRLSSLIRGYLFSSAGRPVNYLLEAAAGVLIAVLLLLALWAFQGRGSSFWAALYQPVERMLRGTAQGAARSESLT